jgi:hypothetical protein
MKKLLPLLLFSLVCACTTMKADERVDLSNQDLWQYIFNGLLASPEQYVDKTGYSVIKKEPIANDYAFRAGVSLEALLTGDGVEVAYWQVKDKWRIQWAHVTVKDGPTYWSNFIGRSMEEVIERIGQPNERTNDAVKYESSSYFLEFYVTGKEVTSVILGRQI